MIKNDEKSIFEAYQTILEDIEEGEDPSGNNWGFSSPYNKFKMIKTDNGFISKLVDGDWSGGNYIFTSYRGGWKWQNKEQEIYFKNKSVKEANYHRLDGPAIKYSDLPIGRYFIDGKEFENESEYLAVLKVEPENRATMTELLDI